MAAGDSCGHTAMFDAVGAIDALCEHLRVPRLSSFLDWRDFAANMAEGEEFPSDEYLQAMATWFEPAKALPMLRALRAHLGRGGTDVARVSETSVLLAGLDDCIQTIEAIERDNDLLHFCVVMLLHTQTVVLCCVQMNRAVTLADRV